MDGTPTRPTHQILAPFRSPFIRESDYNRGFASMLCFSDCSHSLPKEQRLALVRVLLNLESAGNVAEVEQSWDDEIRARIKAVDEGRVTGLAYDDLRKEMNSR